MKRLIIFLSILVTFAACNTDRRSDQGEYSEENDAIIEKDSVSQDNQ